jgi:hypothetical protein
MRITEAIATGRLFFHCDAGHCGWVGEEPDRIPDDWLTLYCPDCRGPVHLHDRHEATCYTS